MNSERIYSLAKWVFRPNAIEELQEELHQLITQSQLESGNLFFHLHRSAKDGNTVFVYEAYEDLSAFEHHKCSTYYMSNVMGKIIPNLVDREFNFLEAPLANLKIY